MTCFHGMTYVHQHHIVTIFKHRYMMIYVFFCNVDLVVFQANISLWIIIIHHKPSIFCMSIHACKPYLHQYSPRKKNFTEFNGEMRTRQVHVLPGRTPGLESYLGSSCGCGGVSVVSFPCFTYIHVNMWYVEHIIYTYDYNIISWYIARSHHFLKSVLSFFRFWYI